VIQLTGNEVIDRRGSQLFDDQAQLID
jgi:hypothetical protein